jgi:hypothetical protein
MDSLLSDAFGLAVTSFVSATVWITLAAGLYQLVREEIHQIHVTPRKNRRLGSYSQQAS